MYIRVSFAAAYFNLPDFHTWLRDGVARLTEYLRSYKNQRKWGLLGPSPNFDVGTSLAVKVTPSARFLFRLSHIMKNPRASAHEAPATPNAAVVINAGAYFGASGLRKMLLLTSPMRLASGTPIEVRSTPAVLMSVSIRGLEFS